MRLVSRRRVLGAVAFAAACALASCFDPPELPPLSSNAGSPNGGDASSPPPANDVAGEGGTRSAAKPEPDGRAGAELNQAGNDATGTTGGSAMGGDGPGVTWLALEGDRAPSSAKVNAGLGVDGRFHVYSDSCATLSWDPNTRCASGNLCDPGADYENWGITVGFDFRETADSPRAALVWDPREVSAVGFAWRISGSAPGLQAWVPNMDPRFNGRCTEMTCEISGPPDGVAAAPLSGELSFSNLQKDYWGGMGVRYVFDPALVYALQLKLPAVNVGAASFSFCIDSLGVVR
jgi:hypothetical protein